MYSVREIAPHDIELLTNYWLKSDDSYLTGMGVDTSKLPAREDFENMLKEQISTPYELKKSYCIIWEADGKPIGHSNVNPITFGNEAFMHLHIWYPEMRGKGIGAELVRKTIPFLFKNLRLQKLISEPYALNPAPHKTLEKAGFKLVKEYTTTPGNISFEQVVKRWEIEREEIIEHFLA